MKHIRFTRMAALLLALLTLALPLLSACGNSFEGAAVRVITLKGPTGMGISGLMEDSAAGTTVNDYTFTLAGAPTEVSAALLSGQVDIAALPTNLAATLYNKTKGSDKEITVLALNTLGVLYVLENGNEINSVADLKGKTVLATGQGSTPEYILRYLLSENGIDPDSDVTIEFKNEHAELASAMAAGQADIAMLPEPNVTSTLLANTDLRIALDLTAEWNKISEDSQLVQGCIVVNKAFAEANPEAVEQFIEEYAASVRFVTENAEDASLLIEKHGIVPKAAVAKKALPNCNICCITGTEMKAALSGFLSVLYDANPASVGGALPDDGFWYGVE